DVQQRNARAHWIYWTIAHRRKLSRKVAGFEMVFVAPTGTRAGSCSWLSHFGCGGEQRGGGSADSQSAAEFSSVSPGRGFQFVGHCTGTAQAIRSRRS